MLDVEKIRKDFPMLKNKMQGKALIYFDNAATTFKPQCVVDALNEYYLNYTANAHRGDYDFAHQVDVKYEEARNKVAQFINANSNEVVFTSGTTMSLNMIAHGLKNITENDEILITEAEHASNVLPWFKLSERTNCKVKYIELDSEGRLTTTNLKKALNPHVKIVSLAHITNVLGYCFDVKEFAKIIHENGSLFILDGAQSVPHMKIDVKDLDVDFLAFSGHKMCGPTGIGVLYGKYQLLEELDTMMVGGGMNSKFDNCGVIGYLYPPQKFEAGTQNIAGAIGLGKAIDYLNSIGMDNIQKYEKELHDYAIKKLNDVDIIHVYNKNADSGIITFNVKNVFAQDAASLFNSYGIAVRSGQHCAKILLNKLDTDATVRASLYFYNTFEEIDAFVEACKKGGDFLDAYFN